MSRPFHLKLPLLLLICLILLAGGCVTESKPVQTVPRRGEVVAQGTGMLSFRAPGPGLVSVYDLNTNSVVESTAVGERSVVLVNPQAGNITVSDADRNGTQIVHTDINKSHRYEMWFIPRSSMDAAATQPLR